MDNPIITGSPGEMLRYSTVPVRLMTNWPTGTKSKAAKYVLKNAKADYLRLTTPFPREGLRLLRKGDVDLFEQEMRHWLSELVIVAKSLRVTDHLLRWRYESTSVPEGLPERIERMEKCAVELEYEDAVGLAEDELAREFYEIVNRLALQLTITPEGKKPVHPKAMIAQLQTFFRRYRATRIRDSGDINDLVARSEDAIDCPPQGKLKDDAGILLTEITEELALVIGIRQAEEVAA